ALPAVAREDAPLLDEDSARLGGGLQQIDVRSVPVEPLHQLVQTRPQRGAPPDPWPPYPLVRAHPSGAHLPRAVWCYLCSASQRSRARGWVPLSTSAGNALGR